MYEEFFGCSRRPFSATPDADCFIPLEGPQAVLDALAVGCERGQGIGVLTGGAGLGKTLVGLRLAFELQPTLETVFLHHSSFPTRRSMLQAILFELKRPYSRMAEQELRLELTAALKALRPEQQALTLILDEAHQLSDALFDELRLLAMLSDRGEPLARIVLIGNPELEERLAAPSLAALNQRVCCQVELSPLTQAESVAYLQDHLEWSGVSADDVFDAEALAFIARAADGVPRCLNQLADHSLLLAYVGEQRPITASVAQQALEDLKQLPLMWHDPIRGGEIYRGRQESSATEDSSDDLWPVQETSQSRTDSRELSGDWEPLDHNGAAVEVGAEAPVVEPATREIERESTSCDSHDQSAAAELPINELSCLRQDWATVPPPEPHSNKWSGGTRPATTDDRITGDSDNVSFDQPTFGQTFGAHDAEFGSPSAGSFQVEEFAGAHWLSDPQESSLCEAIIESVPFGMADHNPPCCNSQQDSFGANDDIEFEEEQVVDRYVRNQTGHDSTGLVWDINLLHKQLSTTPVPPPLPTQPEFNTFQTETPAVLPPNKKIASESESDSEGVVQDFGRPAVIAADSANHSVNDNRGHDEFDLEEFGDHEEFQDSTNTISAEFDQPVTAETSHQPDADILGLSDRDAVAHESGHSWELPEKLLTASNADDDIENQIGADVLDLYLNTRHAMADRDPPSGRPTISLERPRSLDRANSSGNASSFEDTNSSVNNLSTSNDDLANETRDHDASGYNANDWSELQAAFDDDEWSDDSSTESDIVQPEPACVTARHAEPTITLAPSHSRKPDIVQRAYNRLFSELRAKQR